MPRMKMSEKTKKSATLEDRLLKLDLKSNLQHSSGLAPALNQQSPKPTSIAEEEEEPFTPSRHRIVLDSMWHGLGLFGESYLLFSIGTMRPIWEYLYPECFAGFECSSTLVNSLTYSVVLGVMTGMIMLGYVANHVGRRKGSIVTATIMASGAWGLTLVAILLVDQVVWLYRSMSLLFFLFGIGVGGEYPLSASSASERSMQNFGQNTAVEKEQRQGVSYSPFNKLRRTNQAQKTLHSDPVAKDQRYRGFHIQVVFSMQGIGILCNSITMTALLLITGQAKAFDDGKEPEYSEASLLAIWRSIYALGALILTYVLISRIQHLSESHVWEDHKKRGERVRQSRPSLLEALVASKRKQEKIVLQQPEFEYTISNVSSLSAPSVTVDYHNQSIYTTGMLPATYPHDNLHPTRGVESCFEHPGLQLAPSTDPEDDLKASPTWLFLQNYGFRLAGSSLSWLLWDVAFYGNKLFQSTFLLTLTGESATLFEFSLAATLNAAVALLGYFGAAMLVDSIGRRNLQQYGFLLTGGLFVSCGFLYYELSPMALVCIYLASSFFGQLGPNATTFLIPAEIFPTEMRSLSHGICAAAGKTGALIAAILFNYMDNELDLFLFCGYASFVACLVTFCTIPETLGLDLYEIDRKWLYILEGRKGEYSGDASHPKFLSYYERAKLYGNDCTHIDME